MLSASRLGINVKSLSTEEANAWDLEYEEEINEDSDEDTANTFKKHKGSDGASSPVRRAFSRCFNCWEPTCRITRCERPCKICVKKVAKDCRDPTCHKGRKDAFFAKYPELSVHYNLEA